MKALPVPIAAPVIDRGRPFVFLGAHGRGLADKFDPDAVGLSSAYPDMAVCEAFSAQGRRVQRAALTAPTGISPAMIFSTCRTVSIDWLSIAGGVRPPMCGVAITFGSFANSGVGIWSSARPTSI